MADNPTLSAGTPPPRTTGGGFRWEPPTAEELQALLPGYTIEKILGRGGMGAVYRGIQTNLDRPVAIKILPPGVEKEDPSFAERFKNEAKLMAKLNHPAVVAVHDFGTTLGGQLYFAMEYVDGSDVAQMIAAQKKLPPEHALAITAHVCDALGAAHELGIVHRDIKPANVLLNMKGQVKVADFGLAKIEELGSHGLTKTGYAMGTPDFVAPEALTLGTAIDGRADIYAVGVMLYQMLTGNIPRGAFKPAFVLVPGLDPRYDPIIQKAMQHDREERYQSSAELRRDLDVILTVPLVQQNAPASAAIPVAQMAQAPGQRSVAQKPQGKPPQPKSTTGTPARQETAPAGKLRSPEGNAHGTSQSPAKPRTPLFAVLGIAAVLGIGAFVMFGGRAAGPPAAAVPPQTALGGPTAPPAKPASVASSTPKPAAIKPAPAAVSSASSSTIASASQSAPFVNSLGMKFVPVPVLSGPTANQRVLFGVWHVRVQDYAAYAKAQESAGKKVDGEWKTANRDGVPVGRDLDHPVVSVSWEDAQAFCKWLTEKEIAEGKLPKGMKYRLPSDEEWSWAVGLPPEVGATPAEKKEKNTVHFPWGKDWPKTNKVGNYAEETFHAKFPKDMGDKEKDQPWIKDYTDGYATTSPVGSFPANAYGLYDMGGNVWQWCEDWFDASQQDRLLRGGSWGNSLRVNLLSSYRSRHKPVDRGNGAFSFRCVLAPTSPTSSAVSSSPSLPISASSDPKFPPGQWVKVFTKAGDLPADLSKPDSGVKWEDGAIVSAGKISEVFFHKLGPLKNGGWRATFSPSSTIEMRLRDYSTISERFFYALRSDNIIFGARKAGKIMPTTLATFTRDNRTPQHPYEFVAVGNRLIARCDGKLVSILEDRRQMEGELALMNFSGTIRDIEVINLDGLSETEALKILGVDEKGNDLRAAVIAQERQAMEQAKVVDAASAIPELKALLEQFVKLTAERVTAPFEADVAKLNAGYLGGIDRKIAEEKAAGHLDGIIALEAEKKLLADQQPIPADDAEGTTANLKALRTIYRAAYAKIEAARVANLKQLTDPLTLRLKQLETDLTKKDRVPDAKTVREYREGLGKSSSVLQLAPATSASSVTAPAQNELKLSTTLKGGVTNSLGMKFVPVKGTEVLFCIHEVRYQDYAAYAAEASGVDGGWKDQSADGYTPRENKEQHPVMKVNWEDAQKFCAWLSKKEGKTYRLPTDQEWSIAVGLGRDEKWKKDTTPATVEKNQTEFPWGDKWPPPKGSGNFSDDSRKAKAPVANAQYLEGYDDGFPTTAPVMRFKPNKLGLYDLEGNVREWVEDWYDNAQKDRVLRGGCWDLYGRASLLSSDRNHLLPGDRYDNRGFRCVLVVSGG